MRLTYEGMNFSGTLTDLKKYLEEKVMREEMEKREKEDAEFMMMHQGDNQSFSA